MTSPRSAEGVIQEICNLPMRGDICESYMCQHWQILAANKIRAYVAEQIGQWQQATALCREHQPSGGVRASCILCGLLRLSAAFSEIDYLCGEPNKMRVSGYDVHVNEQAVIDHVKALKERARVEE